MKPQIKNIPIAKIRRDSGAQFRTPLSKGFVEGKAWLKERQVQEIVEALEDGKDVRPIIVFFDGQENWLGDGDHRIEAYGRLGRTSIPAEIRKGERIDARRFGRKANAEHKGLQRTRETKRWQVEDSLRDPDWFDWSDVAISEWCDVSSELVRKMRHELGLVPVHTSNIGSMNGNTRTFVHPKTGQPTQMQVGNIGRQNTNNEAAPNKDGTPENNAWISVTEELPEWNVLVETGLLEDTVIGNVRESFVQQKESGEVVAWNFDGCTEDSTVEWPCTHYRYKSSEDQGDTAQREGANQDNVAGDTEGDDTSQSNGNTGNATTNGNSVSGSVPAGTTGNGPQSQKDSPPQTLESQLKALPLFQSLELYGHGGLIFLRQGILWHNSQNVFKAAQRMRSQTVLSVGPITDIVRAASNVPDPAEWEGCPACKGSTRVGERNDPCSRCKGGFVIYKNEGVSVEAVRHHAESLIEAARQKAATTSAPSETHSEVMTETPDAVAITAAPEPTD